ncbi:MAG TPA: ankyrin repeat domain-containing protein, partial [Gammaproteobacteria bacterium]|nr:ankyrin repeat domain-containing protein [Gammaproteobacteria bacterium]
ARIAAHQYDLATLKTLFAISLNGNNKPFNVITNEGLVMLDCLLLEAAGSSVDTPAEARETIQFLLGQGANVLAKSPTDGKSALMLASQNYNKPVVDILVAHNMTPDHINAVDLIGKTALFYVCIARNHDDTRDAIASVLLNCNADLTITYRGRRPGDYIHAPRSVLYATANLDNNIQAGQQLMGFPAAGQQLVYFPQSLQVPQPYRLAEEERKLAQMIMNVGFHQEQHKKAVKNVSELLHNVALINEDIKNICNLIATQYYLIDGQQNIVNALKNTSNNNNSNLPNTYPLNPVVGNVGVLPQWTAAMQNQVQAGAQALTQLQGLQNLKRPAENNNYLNNNNGNSNSNSNDKQGDPVAQITKKTK